MTPLLAANWKMNKTAAEASAWIEEFLQAPLPASVEVALFPPFTALCAVGERLAGRLAYGAQDVSDEDEGPFTGEISARMLAELGCGYAIVGHSERRARHREDDAQVGRKAAQLLRFGLRPILCLGEPWDVRQQGQAIPYVEAQLTAALKEVPAEARSQLTLAYEPIWAIGTGVHAHPEEVQAMHEALRAKLQELTPSASEVRILYGGSLNPENAMALFAQPQVDGGLVGGASLKAGTFRQLVEAAARAKEAIK
jgi:triosephosphate isomerase